ncbi:2Fe-2S iron-sulfur cluster-binding protein [Streptomyces abikoensis]|uniref:2Fe-2S iron-sulfur cluster-binding protein n=1 Tax=Streptomyces abikoensis TaxID=97398 RepID=UPI0037154F68
MSDDQQRHTHAPAPGAGGWQPIPQGAGLEAEGTTFVQLPPELLAQTGPGTGAGWSPLAAPGTGYAPPVVDSWQQQAPQHPAPHQHEPQVPVQQHWDAYEHRYVPEQHVPDRHMPEQHVPGQHVSGQHVPEQHLPGQHVPEQHVPGADDGGAADPHATAQWQVSFAADEAVNTTGPEPVNHPGPGATGQWSVPAAGDDSVEESGEYALRGSAEQQQWTVPAARDASAGYGTGVADVIAEDRPVTGAGDNPTDEWTAAAEPVVTGEATETAEADAEAEVETQPEQEAEQEPEADLADGQGQGEAEVLEQGQAEAQEKGDQPLASDIPPADVPPADAPSADAPAPADPQPYLLNEHPCASYVLRVNGTDRPVTDAWIGESLLYVLRERLGLAGAKDGCSQGECGACSVQVDGRLVASCLVPAATTAGSEVRTVEGLAAHGQPSDVQRALAECGAVQCGFCVPGLAMTVHDLLEGNHAPTELETRQAICGNLCRCSGYRGVLEAVRQVVDERAETAALEEEAAAQEEQAQGLQTPDAGPDTMGIPHQQPGPYGDGPHGDGSYGDGSYAQAPYGEEAYGTYDSGAYETGAYDTGSYGGGGPYGDGPYGDGGTGSGFGKATA